MTPERLSKVATAAGFAMAPQDDFASEPSERSETAVWGVVQSKLLPVEQPASALSTATGWLRGAFGSLGRGAPA